MRALEALPDGRSETVTATTSLAPYRANQVDTSDVVDLISERLKATADTARRIHDVVDAEDRATADMLHAANEKLKQYAWMVGAEHQKPRKRAS